MPDVKIKGWSGTEFSYSDVPKIWLDAAQSTEETPVLVPYTYGEAVSKTVEPDFSAGDMAVPIADGELVTELTIAKPDTLVPENIAKDIEIAGVVGTHEGGGVVSVGDRHIMLIDYDGTFLAESYLNEGDTFTLPDAPSHERLIFDGWSASTEIVDNTITVGNNDIMVRAMYHTVSGATEFDIELTAVTGLTFEFQNVLTGMTSIDWGDGTANSILSHTYSSPGEYTIKVYGLTAITTSTSACGSSNTGNWGIVQNSFNNRCKIRNVFFSNSITSIGNYTFQSCYSLTNVVLSNSITTIGSNAFLYCYSLASITIPNSVRKIMERAFQNCYALTSIMLPKSVTSIGIYVFNGCSSLANVVIQDGTKNILSYEFYGCSGLVSIIIPNSVTSIGDNAFASCSRLTSIVIPNSVTSIGSYAFSYCQILTKIVISNSITSIGKYAFQYCYRLKEYDFSDFTSIPTISSTTVFNGINAICKMLIPSALYSSWKIANNWSTYAKYMVAV